MHGHPRLEINMLGEQSEVESARTHHIAAIGRLFAADQAKQSGLARAVAPDETDMLARIDLERCAAQHILGTVRLMNIRETKQHVNDKRRWQD
jgi:enoyl-CoA hydratase/carnithine racemase